MRSPLSPTIFSKAPRQLTMPLHPRALKETPNATSPFDVLPVF